MMYYCISVFSVDCVFLSNVLKIHIVPRNNSFLNFLVYRASQLWNFDSLTLRCYFYKNV